MAENKSVYSAQGYNVQSFYVDPYGGGNWTEESDGMYWIDEASARCECRRLKELYPDITFRVIKVTEIYRL